MTVATENDQRARGPKVKGTIDPADDQLAPLQYEAAPLRNKIIMALRRAVETGILEPGRRLVEKDLCAQLNVSRTSLREALRQLQAEGILTDTAGRGLAVVQISREDAENVYRIRGVIEALVVGQFIEKATEAETLKAAYLSGVAERIVAAKRQFYDRVCSVAGNPIALDLLNKLTLLTSPLRRLSVARKERQLQSVAEIDILMTAIERRDIAAAKAAAEQHVLNSAVSALPFVEAKPAPRRAGQLVGDLQD